MQVGQGLPITLEVQYQGPNGALVDPSNPHVEILDPQGLHVVDGDVPTRQEVGIYYYDYTVPPLAPVGSWRIQWFGTLNNQTVFAEEAFDVVPASLSGDISQITTHIRRLIGERIPVGKTDVDTRFTDQEIADTYYYNNSDFTKAVAELWLAKSAMFAELVDITERGTTRYLSQLQRAADRQYQRWYDKVKVYDDAWIASQRIVGRSFCIPSRRHYSDRPQVMFGVLGPRG